MPVLHHYEIKILNWGCWWWEFLSIFCILKHRNVLPTTRIIPREIQAIISELYAARRVRLNQGVERSHERSLRQKIWAEGENIEPLKLQTNINTGKQKDSL